MSNQAKIILLCEDKPQAQLTRAYLKKSGAENLEHELKQFIVGSYTQVLDRFPVELRALRRRHSTSLLVVLIDADQLGVEERWCQLRDRATAFGLEAPHENEPVFVFVPKRNVETWLEALWGDTVNEKDSYKKRKKLTSADYRKAANALYDWSRANAQPGSTIVDSLFKALPEWKRLGEKV